MEVIVGVWPFGMSLYNFIHAYLIAGYSDAIFQSFGGNTNLVEPLPHYNASFTASGGKYIPPPQIIKFECIFIY